MMSLLILLGGIAIGVVIERLWTKYLYNDVTAAKNEVEYLVEKLSALVSRVESKNVK